LLDFSKQCSVLANSVNRTCSCG